MDSVTYSMTGLRNTHPFSFGSYQWSRAHSMSSSMALSMIPSAGLPYGFMSVSLPVSRPACRVAWRSCFFPYLYVRRFHTIVYMEQGNYMKIAQLHALLPLICRKIPWVDIPGCPVRSLSCFPRPVHLVAIPFRCRPAFRPVFRQAGRGGFVSSDRCIASTSRAVGRGDEAVGRYGKTARSAYSPVPRRFR